MILRCTAGRRGQRPGRRPATKVNRKGTAVDPPTMVERASGQLQVAEATGTGSHNFPLEDGSSRAACRHIARTLRRWVSRLIAAAMARWRRSPTRCGPGPGECIESEGIVKDDPGDAFVNKDDETLETFCAEHTAECYQGGMLTEKAPQLERGAAEHV